MSTVSKRWIPAAVNSVVRQASGTDAGHRLIGDPDAGLFANNIFPINVNP